jgi:signal transduction histidine kinase/ActR/RegA family two-component response regulator
VRPIGPGPSPSTTIRLTAGLSIVAWTVAVLVSYELYARHVRAGVVALAAAQARAAFEKDLAYRRWVSERGGVYVEPDERTPPNPYLRAPRRDVVVADGRRLTLVNPAYMTRQVLEDERRRGGVAARITSARPKRPENGPVGWEAAALGQLAAGAREVVEESLEDPPMLRYMGALVSEPRCVACHPDVRPGELRGGISIEVPLTPYLDVSVAQSERIAAGHAVVWALGAAAVTLTASRASRRNREQERARAQREALEQELAHARRLEALGRLAGGVAHDLNNLLSPILGNASLALDRVQEPELRQDLEDIRDAGQRARILTQQLLAFGRKQVLSLEPLDPSTAVAAIVPMIRRLVGEAIEVRSDFGPGVPAVRADRAQLGAALLNLAANARDAMPEGGTLTLSTGLAEVDAARAARLGLAPGRCVAITVSDTGVGIDELTRGRLFEPFFTTKESGHGLGLASAHGTVRQLGGAMEVESALGRGATFRVLLPVLDDVSAAAARTPPPAAPDVPRGTETVLLAEDDPAVRRYVGAALRALGYRVLAADGGEEALALSRGHRGEVHVLVSDLQMPQMGGPELRARLVAERPRLATVFITGYAGDTLGPAHAAPAGALVIVKPFTPDELGRALRRALDAAAAAAGPQAPSAASRS